MKKSLVIAFIILLLSSQAYPCVGRVLNIGAVHSPDGLLLSEMLSSLITERTGTTVAIRLFESDLELHEAVKARQVDILIDNTTSALNLLNKPISEDVDKNYESVKALYEKEKGLVWLKPFGFRNGSRDDPSYTAAVLRTDVLTNFPALPRVIGKLANALNDETHARLIRSVESGQKPKTAARDFLKTKKLI